MVLEAVEGDARNVLCDAVEKHHATMLAVGSHGYGAIKRYLLHEIIFAHRPLIIIFHRLFLHLNCQMYE